MIAAVPSGRRKAGGRCRAVCEEPLPVRCLLQCLKSAHHVLDCIRVTRWLPPAVCPWRRCAALAAAMCACCLELHRSVYTRRDQDIRCVRDKAAAACLGTALSSAPGLHALERLSASWYQSSSLLCSPSGICTQTAHQRAPRGCTGRKPCVTAGNPAAQVDPHE